jgi:hypothetical protein
MSSTIDDVFQEIQKVNTHLQEIEGTLNSALPALVTNSAYVTHALAFFMKQNEAILCNLSHISQNTCGTWNEAATQTRLQMQIAGAVERIKDLLNSAHGTEAINLDRLEHMRKQLEECCPTHSPPPPCANQPCFDPGPGPQPPPSPNPIP